jgi:hypothetical protein
MGFGFPSEILLAPGFLWIALFMIVKNRVLSILFLLSLAGLVFSHELAFPSALVASYLAVRQVWDEGRQSNRISWRTFAALAMISSVFACFIYARLTGGGAGSDHTAIHAIDPRRIVNNPTLWVVVVAIAGVITASRLSHSLVRNRAGAAAFALGSIAALLPNIFSRETIRRYALLRSKS